MNILVTGANGQLGNEMQIVSKASSKDKYIFTDVCDGYTHLDITNIDAIRQMVKDNDMKCIINCAAWTNVDKAETAGEIVETLNATAPENLAKVMKEVVHHSAHRLALLRVRSQLRKNDAQPHGYSPSAEGGLRPMRHTNLCRRLG